MQAVTQEPVRSTFAAMFAETFGLGGETDVTADQATESAEASAGGDVAEAKQKTIGEAYYELYLMRCAEIERRAKADQDAHQIEMAFLNAIAWNTFRPCSHPADKHDAGYQKLVLAREVLEQLRRVAMVAFAPQGVTLTIGENEVHERFAVNNDSLSDFDPRKVWAYFEEKYGGDYGARVAWQQVANALRAHLLGRNADGVVMKGGYAILNISVWVDSFDKKYHPNSVSYSSWERVQQACNCLSEFAVWAGRERLAREVLAVNRRMGSGIGYRDVVSRKQYGFGENAEIVIVTYLTRFEIRLRVDVAEQLQVFVGTFGSQD